MAVPTGLSYENALAQGWKYDQASKQWAAPEDASPEGIAYDQALRYGWAYDQGTGKWTPPEKGFDPATGGYSGASASVDETLASAGQDYPGYVSSQATKDTSGGFLGGSDLAKSFFTSSPVLMAAGIGAAPVLAGATGLSQPAAQAAISGGGAALGGAGLQGAATAAGLSYASGSITGGGDASSGSSAPGENTGAMQNFQDSVDVQGFPAGPSNWGNSASPAGRDFTPNYGAGDPLGTAPTPAGYPSAGVPASDGATEINLAAPTGPAQVDLTPGQDAGTGSGGGDVPGTSTGGPFDSGLALAAGTAGLGASFPSSGGGSGASGGGGGGGLGGGETLGGQDYGGENSFDDGSMQDVLNSGKSELETYWDKVAGGLGVAGGALAKYGPLGLGIAGFNQSKKSGQAAAQNLKAIGGPQADLGKSLVDGYQNGTLNPADTAAIDRWAAQQIAAIKQHMANAGTSDSTQSLALQREISARAEEMKAVSRENLLKIGLQALNTTDQYQVAAVNAELNADQNAINFASRFMGTYAQWLYAGSRMVAPETQSKLG